MLQEYERRMLSYGVPAPPPVPPPPAAAPPQQLYGGHGGLVGADLGAQHGGHGVKQVSKNPPSVRIFKAHLLRSIRTSYFHIRLL